MTRRGSAPWAWAAAISSSVTPRWRRNSRGSDTFAAPTPPSGRSGLTPGRAPSSSPAHDMDWAPGAPTITVAQGGSMGTKLGVLAAATGLVLAAAGASGPAAVTVVTRSASSTSSARSARVSMTVVIKSSSGPLAAGRSLQSDGAVDFAGRQATFRVTTDSGNIDAVIDGTVVYEHIPQLAPAVGGKTWLKIDLKTVGQLVGVPGLSSVFQSQPSDPTQALAYLRGASSQIATVGHEEVRGVRTTHYRATVDLNKAASSLGADQQAAHRQLIDRLA